MMKQRTLLTHQYGFSLIELLVVVAIIIILAALGVVAYQEYTENSKIAVTKGNHKKIVKFVSASLILCEMGGINVNVQGCPPRQTCLGLLNANGNVTAISCTKSYHDMAKDFSIHFAALGLRNPFNDESATECSRKRYIPGCAAITEDFTNFSPHMRIVSCWGDICPGGDPTADMTAK